MLQRTIFTFSVNLSLVLASLSGLPVAAQPETKFTIAGAKFSVANGSRGKLTPLPGEVMRLEANGNDPLFVSFTFNGNPAARFEATQVVVHFRSSNASLVSVEVSDPQSREVLKANTDASGNRVSAVVYSPSSSANAWKIAETKVPKTIGAGTIIRLGIGNNCGFEGCATGPVELIAVDVNYKNPGVKFPPASTTVKPNSPGPVRATVPASAPPAPTAPPVSSAASVPNIPHSNGVIYIVNDANDLRWYRHDGRADGSFKWANDGSAVGHGWDFRTVLGGGDGVMYALTREGDLIWYRHTGGGDGSFHWAQDKGQTVNSWFSGMQVVAAGNGVLYALNHKTGELLWYRHEGYLDGTDRWVAREGRVIASDWRGILLFAGDAGTLYAIARGGDLYRFRYDGRADGSGTLPFDQGQKIASNWNHYLFPFSGGDGIIYALSSERELLWFRDEGWQDGTVRWASPEPKIVGNGWQFKTIFSGASLKP
jgi:hypothetical protein